MRFKKSSSLNKLFRHGRYFDKILSLDDKVRQKVTGYKPDQFQTELTTDKELQLRYSDFIKEIKSFLTKNKTSFLK